MIRGREKDDRGKKWDSQNDRDRIRRTSGNTQPVQPPFRGAAPTTPNRIPMYGDPRGNSNSSGPPGLDTRTPVNSYNDQDRWSQRDRYIRNQSNHFK